MHFERARQGHAQVNRIFAQVDDQLAVWRTKFTSSRKAVEVLQPTEVAPREVPAEFHATAAPSSRELQERRAADRLPQIDDMRCSISQLSETVKSQGAIIALLQQSLLERQSENIELRARLNLLEQVVQTLIHSPQQRNESVKSAQNTFQLDFTELMSLIHAVGGSGSHPSIPVTGLSNALQMLSDDLRAGVPLAHQHPPSAINVQQKKATNQAREKVMELPGEMPPLSAWSSPDTPPAKASTAAAVSQQHSHAVQEFEEKPSPLDFVVTPQRHTANEAARPVSAPALKPAGKNKPFDLKSQRSGEAHASRVHPVEMPKEPTAEDLQLKLQLASRDLLGERAMLDARNWHTRSDDLLQLASEERSERFRIAAVEKHRAEVAAEVAARRARAAEADALRQRENEAKETQFKAMAMAAAELPSAEHPGLPVPPEGLFVSAEGPSVPVGGKAVDPYLNNPLSQKTPVDPKRDPFDSSDEEQASPQPVSSGQLEQTRPAPVDPAASKLPEQLRLNDSDSDSSNEQDPFTFRPSRGRGVGGRGVSRSRGRIVGLAPIVQQAELPIEEELPPAPQPTERPPAPVPSMPSPDFQRQPPRSQSKESDDDFIF